MCEVVVGFWGTGLELRAALRGTLDFDDSMRAFIRFCARLSRLRGKDTFLNACFSRPSATLRLRVPLSLHYGRPLSFLHFVWRRHTSPSGDFQNLPFCTNPATSMSVCAWSINVIVVPDLD